MKKADQFTVSRRAFIKTALRVLTGGGILTTGAILAWRSKQKAGVQEECPLDIPCKGCSKFSGCNDTRAQKIKNIASRGGGRVARS